MAQNPALSVKYLIESLHVIKQTKLRSDLKDYTQESERVIWSIRALRFLTDGKDFKAETNYVFKKDEEHREYWLTREDKDQLPFFAVWMSRDKAYIAPKDVQEKIIEKWKKWYATEGTTYKYGPFSDPVNYYF